MAPKAVRPSKAARPKPSAPGGKAAGNGKGPSAGAAPGRASKTPGLAAGDPAPDISLLSDSGKTVSLRDFKGKQVVLYFYPKDMTGGCTAQACAFRDNLNRLSKSGAAVLGVSADSVESHRKFKDKQSLNFPLLSDPDHKALDAYGVWQQKSLYGRKFMGIVRTTFLIDAKGKIAKVFPKVKVAGHVDEVVTALKSL